MRKFNNNDDPSFFVGYNKTDPGRPWTLEEFNLDLRQDVEDWDLDDAPWAPCRPTYGALSGAETSVHTTDAELPEWFLRDVWKGTDANGDHPGHHVVELEKLGLSLKPRPLHRQCYMCGQLFKVDLAEEHYDMCRAEAAAWEAT